MAIARTGQPVPALTGQMSAQAAGTLLGRTVNPSWVPRNVDPCPSVPMAWVFPMKKQPAGQRPETSPRTGLMGGSQARQGQAPGLEAPLVARPLHLVSDFPVSPFWAEGPVLGTGFGGRHYRPFRKEEANGKTSACAFSFNKHFYRMALDSVHAFGYTLRAALCGFIVYHWGSFCLHACPIPFRIQAFHDRIRPQAPALTPKRQTQHRPQDWLSQGIPSDFCFLVFVFKAP